MESCTADMFPFFFFFQAEDGIRDYKVTGVQTCALPISRRRTSPGGGADSRRTRRAGRPAGRDDRRSDRKSTRLNSSHLVISYAVFCLKKKKKKESTHDWALCNIDVNATHLTVTTERRAE